MKVQGRSGAEDSGASERPIEAKSGIMGTRLALRGTRRISSRREKPTLTRESRGEILDLLRRDRVQVEQGLQCEVVRFGIRLVLPMELGDDPAPSEQLAAQIPGRTDFDREIDEAQDSRVGEAQGGEAIRSPALRRALSLHADLG